MGQNDTTVTPPESIRFADVAAVMRRHLSRILGGLLVGINVAGVLFLLIPATYSSGAAVTISPVLLGSSADLKAVSTSTETGVVTSTSVADRAAVDLGWKGDPAALLGSLTVTSPLDSQLLDIKFSSSTPAGAAAGANAFAQAYLDYRTETAQAELQARSDKIQKRITELDTSSAAQDAIIASKTATDAQKTQAKAVKATAARLTSQLRDQQAAIQTTPIEAGELVDKARPPVARDFPQLPTMLAAGAMFGLLGGVVLALARRTRNDRVVYAHDLESSVGEPVLATIPAERHKGRRQAGSVALASDPGNPEADAYRILATKLTAPTDDWGRTILVCSTGDAGWASGVTSTAALNTALAIAGQGKQVALLGSGPSILEACVLLDAPLPRDDEPTDGLIEYSRHGSLRLVSFGDELAVQATLGANEDVLRLITASVHTVVIDGVNVHRPSTVMALGARSDDCVVVVHRWGARMKDVTATVHELRQVTARVSGLVLVIQGRRRSRRRQRHTATATPRAERSALADSRQR